MRTEHNFFPGADQSTANNPLGSESHRSSELRMGMFQFEDEMSLMARIMYNIAKSHHDQFLAARAQELALLNAEPAPIHHPGLVFPAPPPVVLAPVSMGVYYGSIEFGERFYSVWNGVHGPYPFHLRIPILYPVVEEHNLGLGLRQTRNFLGAMESQALLNPNHANEAQDLNLRLGSPEQFTVTDPIANLEADNEEEAVAAGGEDLDLDLKL